MNINIHFTNENEIFTMKIKKKSQSEALGAKNIESKRWCFDVVIHMLQTNQLT